MFPSAPISHEPRICRYARMRARAGAARGKRFAFEQWAIKGSTDIP